MNRVTIFAGAVLVSALVVLGLVLSSSSTHDATPPTPLPACAFEDGSGGATPCAWNAKTQGNGRGQSYVVSGAPKTWEW